MLKELFKKAREEKKANRNPVYPSLSISLFDEGKAYYLEKEELKALLQEAIYLLRDCNENAENELMEAMEEWHEELFEEDEDKEFTEKEINALFKELEK